MTHTQGLLGMLERLHSTRQQFAPMCQSVYKLYVAIDSLFVWLTLEMPSNTTVHLEVLEPWVQTSKADAVNSLYYMWLQSFRDQETQKWRGS